VSRPPGAEAEIPGSGGRNNKTAQHLRFRAFAFSRTCIFVHLHFRFNICFNPS